MKRILAFLLLAALLLTLAGCGGPGTVKEENMEETPAPGATAEPAPKGEPTPDGNTVSDGGNTPGGEPGPSGDNKPAPALTDTPADLAEAGALAEVLARAVYPEMVQYPDPESNGGRFDNNAWNAWRESVAAQRKQKAGYDKGLEDYLRASLTEFLSGAGDSNRVCAPLNIYLCLAMLAEVTDGESRAQVLSLLGEKNMTSLRSRAKALWNAEYRDDGMVTCRLAASMWLNQHVNYIQETMDTLAETYYASGFRGEMGSAEYDRALQNWLNEQTGDLLADQASGLHMDARTVLALATTIYFKAPWTNKFNEAGTSPQTFHGVRGDEETDFLHQSGTGTYYWGENFSAVARELENGGAMWFILPDEGYSPEDLLAGEAMDFLLSREKTAWKNKKSLMIHFAAPRFDVSSDLDLVPGLKNLGLRDVFDMEASDFTPLTKDTDEIFVSQAQHAARVMIDEEGCTGAAYTVMMMAAGSAMPPADEVEFTADRPFIFAVTNWDGLPLFAGVVNSTK